MERVRESRTMRSIGASERKSAENLRGRGRSGGEEASGGRDEGRFLGWREEEKDDDGDGREEEEEKELCRRI